MRGINSSYTIELKKDGTVKGIILYPARTATVFGVCMVVAHITTHGIRAPNLSVAWGSPNSDSLGVEVTIN